MRKWMPPSIIFSDFDPVYLPPKEMISSTEHFRTAPRAVKKKLSWLDCQVSVVDSDTYRKEIFSVQK